MISGMAERGHPEKLISRLLSEQTISTCQGRAFPVKAWSPLAYWVAITEVLGSEVEVEGGKALISLDSLVGRSWNDFLNES